MLVDCASVSHNVPCILGYLEDASETGASLKVHWTLLRFAPWFTASKSTGKYKIENFPAQRCRNHFAAATARKENDIDPTKNWPVQ